LKLKDSFDSNLSKNLISQLISNATCLKCKNISDFKIDNFLAFDLDIPDNIGKDKTSQILV
jgi:hypothetical protein